jgi:hypothetical protein
MIRAIALRRDPGRGVPLELDRLLSEALACN